MKKKTIENLESEIKSLNNGILLTPNQIYTNTNTHMEFICKNKHIWTAKPNVILRGCGCPLCYKEQDRPLRVTLEGFRLKLSNINTTRISQIHILEDTWKGVETKHKFGCEYGHVWLTTPDNIIHRLSGCPMCYGNNKKTTESFQRELYNRSIDNPGFQIALEDGQEYINASTKLLFVCSNKHNWVATPSDILSGYGCPTCARKPFSRKAIKWLKSIEDILGYKIQHAENLGEYIIPGTLYRADGYDKHTNTIYEYHGNRFHGNPDMFNPTDKCHPFDKELTAGILFNRTTNKENKIRELGYNLIIQWET